ncbi:N-succinylarginine dihydrolase [Novosphingobium sp.]|uniref:N-succinylarginine dihydrolase n=1 Tax=Novosphingobium sp. TaxID=1874826 RepID=UPI0022CBC402|nr:N-succinylarginine dihydrolase [Novosphingobium sp.]MCZ8019405.1 N-succinylarginine dihydrolase [Novosphingobium sp.]MCZ8035220.1 N-succinylarginine dihydrolase [Novosphingobium sp.]MCZ8050534.1 N-succinylarginine dihydrolase [Novosphingobium sp.]MCZ8058880.1 N-succinylarginine dihydrolase [Novosphingobium sp.]MCZ8232325.1 N-succinylarginine dihydrolase [Novosphingobium sp.]
MSLVEINFDGIVGPSHNYAGLSLGNIASASNAGDTSYPRAAALQGLGKMRHNLGLGLTQGFLLPLPRPNGAFLAAIGADGTEDRRLLAAAWSASSMWTANAATVSPAPDTADGRCHLTAANLVTMPHRSQEWPDTVKQLRIAFADATHFAVHDAVPTCFGDEGAANHMRMGSAHGAPGIEIFVYGKSGGPFPARQHEQASRAVARLHGLDPARTLFVEQNPEAIAAGAFHNDVVAVANERVLFTHEQAFADPEGTYAAIRAALPEAEIVVVPADAVSLADAIKSYLFNAQLLTLPSGEQALVIPLEAWEHPRVRAWLDGMLASNGPIRRVLPVDVRQSMANGGGPACLRLRVVADPATVDPRFLLDEAKIARIEAVVAAHWPEAIRPDQLGDPALAEQIIAARLALLEALDLGELA